MRSSLVFGVALAATFLPNPSPAQRGRDRDEDRSERSQGVASRIDSTFTFSRSGVVDLTQISGDIVVTAWERGEARVRAFAERGNLRASLSSSRLALEVEPERGRVGDTRFEVSVPVGVRVLARSRSGDVTVRGTRGAVEVSSTSGDIVVADAAERIVLETLTGDVRASALTGTVRGESVNGTLEFSDVTGEIRLETTSGDVILTDVTSRDVLATTVAGDIEYAGTIDANGRYEFHSHSGDIRLEIPDNAKARLTVETFSGALDSEFPVTLQPGQRVTGRPRRFELALGGGGARIIAESFSGDIIIGRRAGSAR